MSWPCNEPFPKAMTPADLMRALDISRATYQRRLKAGQFRRFLVANPVGSAKFSGVKVQEWCDGQRTAVTLSFGTRRLAS